MKSSKYIPGFEEKVLNALNNLQTDVSGLKTDVSELKTDVRRLEILHEETDSKIEHIIEDLLPTMKETTKLREHQQEQDDKISFHDRRINVLEKKLA